MFVEYMALKDKKEAQVLFDASAKMKPSDKDELYIVKDNLEYQAILKIKKFRKKYSEQKWLLSFDEKGVSAKREMTKAYFLEILVTIISAILFVILLAMAFIRPDMIFFLFGFRWLHYLFFYLFLGEKCLSHRWCLRYF